MTVVGTNFLIRVITGDVPVQAKEAFAIIEAMGSGEITICEAVITEVCFVLEFHQPYRLTHREIADSLGIIFDNGAFTVPTELREAVSMYGTHPKLDFVDSSTYPVACHAGTLAEGSLRGTVGSPQLYYPPDVCHKIESLRL